VNKKAEYVGKLFNLDCRRFAKTVARFGLDTDYDRCVATLTELQTSCKFEGMTRHDTIIMVCGEDQGSWIDRPWSEVMVGGIGI
jgi:hypothetical protein